MDPEILAQQEQQPLNQAAPAQGEGQAWFRPLTPEQQRAQQLQEQYQAQRQQWTEQERWAAIDRTAHRLEMVLAQAAELMQGMERIAESLSVLPARGLAPQPARMEPVPNAPLLAPELPQAQVEQALEVPQGAPPVEALAAAGPGHPAPATEPGPGVVLPPEPRSA